MQVSNVRRESKNEKHYVKKPKHFDGSEVNYQKGMIRNMCEEIIKTKGKIIVFCFKGILLEGDFRLRAFFSAKYFYSLVVWRTVAKALGFYESLDFPFCPGFFLGFRLFKISYKNGFFLHFFLLCSAPVLVNLR